ncbi:lamin tail domain-containing protein [Acidimicrobiia bacterium EGI L10123]|uniref:lamin tail domain-containing protein n=1 Tax=Salinilacustrithrix flava TaxID=2957203 RepID=UPI003D7C1E59|nr:lamin tail domain-containing protein [Acidimicrobiia bacterium EGI L10123]
MRFPVTVLVSLLALAGCGTTTSEPETGASSSTSESTTTTSASPGTDPPTPAGDGARVVEVVDGDTIRVEVAGQQESVRLIGINTPERGECLSDEATGRLQDLVAGQTVELVVDRTDRDQYGRLLRHVEVAGVDVGAELVRSGHALAREYPPDTGRSEAYAAAQRSAEDDGVGMWATNACGSGTSGADVVIDAIRFDADGDDNENLNDEWVRIANRSGSAVDLTGWVLKDTSATHRFSFPGGFSLEPGTSVTVRTGCGSDSATDLHWCNQGSAVWNNSGDTAFLLDPAGNIVASQDG